jgi:hypothetical protein
MNDSEIRAAMGKARTCAMVMLESAIYIERELPNVQLDEALLSQARQVCSDLIGTKHDIISDLFELNDEWGAFPAPGLPNVLSTMERLTSWMWEDISKMDQLVSALDAAAKRDPTYGLAYLLIAECATNVLNAFNATTAAVDGLKAG